MLKVQIGQINQVTGIPWKRQVKYLDIKITISLDAAALQVLNIDPLIKEAEKQIDSWQSLGILWFGKVAAIKMKILPNLYLYSDH